MTETRKLTTILAADVAGYSRLTSVDEEGTLARLRELRRALIEPTVAANRGRIVKTAGDGLLIEFASVVDATRCAITVQRDIAIRNADILPGKQIEFRVGGSSWRRRCGKRRRSHGRCGQYCCSPRRNLRARKGLVRSRLGRPCPIAGRPRPIQPSARLRPRSSG